MIKTTAVGLLAAVFAFFVAITAVNAQTVSPSQTISPTPTSASSQNTPGAPNTGF